VNVTLWPGRAPAGALVRASVVLTVSAPPTVVAIGATRVDRVVAALVIVALLIVIVG
jgi:hypothetical protein